MSFGKLLATWLNNRMLSFKNWFVLSEQTREFSNTQVAFNKKDADHVLSWSKDHISKSDLVEKGFEDEVHVTVLFGLHTAEYKPVEDLIHDYGSFEIQLGKISKFESKDYDVIKIEVTGDRLVKLHHLLKKLPHTSSFPNYKAHCTLAYVKKGSCDDLLGNDYFAGRTIKVDSIVFSSKNGVKTSIDLG